MISERVEAMKIALPTSTFLPGMGGVEVGLHNIASRLAHRGHRPVLIIPATNYRALARTGWQLPYETISFPPKIWGVLRWWPALGLALFDRFFGRLQRHYHFHFWHCTVGYPTGVALVHFSHCYMAVPHLVRCAGEDVQRSPTLGYGARLRPSVDRLVRRWLSRADRLVAISESVADEYLSLGAPKENIARVPNGVEINRFQRTVDRGAVRRWLGVPEDAFLFLTVGRHHPKKNFASVIRALASITNRNSANVHALLVGRQVKKLRNLVRSLGLGERVHLHDQIGGDLPPGTHPKLPADELIEIYLAADAFVFPSLMETFGIVLVEAMAARLPIITADSPGCRDVVRSSSDGMVVTPGDDTALAYAMEALSTDRQMHEDYAQRSWARAQQFSWDSVVDQYAHLYQIGIEEFRTRRSGHIGGISGNSIR